MAIVRCIDIIVLALISAARLHAQADPLVQVGQLPVDGGGLGNGSSSLVGMTLDRASLTMMFKLAQSASYRWRSVASGG
jgi:hypothetical protein